MTSTYDALFGRTRKQPDVRTCVPPPVVTRFGMPTQFSTHGTQPRLHAAHNTTFTDLYQEDHHRRTLGGNVRADLQPHRTLVFFKIDGREKTNKVNNARRRTLALADPSRCDGGSCSQTPTTQRRPEATNFTSCSTIVFSRRSGSVVDRRANGGIGYRSQLRANAEGTHTYRS